jgi:hypothetical protein
MASFAGYSVFGDEHTVDLESVLLESFDGETTHQWSFGGKSYSYDFEWKVDASKFATNFGGDAYPKLSYIPAWPQAVFGTNREGRDLKSLGVWGKFDRRGYNWIDVYPAVVGSDANGQEPEPFEIPIPGRVSYLDLWVWGSNLNYYLEAYFRDYQGVVHSLYLGNLAYQGWKNLRVRMPTSIPQSKRILPHFAGLTFVKFRLWTTPVERVDNFYVYFKQMKILSDGFESLFDGDELADPERVQELWGQIQASR